MSKIAWSWSRLELFEQCPKQFYHLNILKDVKRKPNQWTERGKFVHNALENSLKYKSNLPPDLRHVQPIIDKMHKVQTAGAKLFSELQLAITEELKPTDWYAKNVWARCIMDVVLEQGDVLHIDDWKTGKVKPPTDQLALNALFGFIFWPDVTTVKTHYVWVDHCQITGQTFHRNQFDSLLRNFGDRAELIQITSESGNWEARKNAFCRYCPLSASQCQFKE